MSQYITLLGAEQVHNAAYRMKDAAESMQCSANQIDESISRLERILENFTVTLQAMLEDKHI